MDKTWNVSYWLFTARDSRSSALGQPQFHAPEVSKQADSHPKTKGEL